MCPSVYELQVATKVAIYNKQCKKQIHIHIYIYIYIHIDAYNICLEND